jgi:alpha-tubulin suppressor-like RCC1 family protein/plastocyanin
MNVTGVVTATLGDVGVAGSIIQGNNIDIGTGIITATSFVGDQIGTYRAASLTGSPDLVVGVVTSSGFVAQITGDVTGNLTGNVVGTAGSILSGNNVRAGIATVAGMSGDGSALTGIAATSYNTQTVPGSTYSINVTSPAGGNYTLSGTDRNGSVSGSDPTVTVEVGDTLNFVVDASGHPFYIRVSDGGANVSTPAATNQGAVSGTVSWTPNTAGTYYYQCGNHAGMLGTITVTATTTIDLSAGNMITFNQEANTTISFANTETAMDVTLIRIKDATTTARTITWPDSVKWNGGTAPTLISDTISGDSQQFQFLTRDSGLTWYAWEPYVYDGLYSALWVFGQNYYGSLGLNSEIAYSSPTQVGSYTLWDKDTLDKTNKYGSASKSGAFKTDGTFWVWTISNYGSLGLNDNITRSSPTQLSGTTWAHMGLGDTHMTAAKTDGTLWSWGDNRYGALGLNQNASPGSRIDYSSPVQVGTDTTWATGACKLVAGAYAGGSIKTDGTLWLWGRNFTGSLGQNEGTPTPGYPGSKSSPTQVPGTTWNTFSQSYSMSSHCHVIKTDGTLWSWGNNTNGKLGFNDIISRSSPTQVGTDTTWSHVSDKSWTLGIKTDGTLWAWGSNAYGALGLSQTGGPTTKISSPTQIPGTTWSKSFSSSTHVAAIKTDGTIWAWGKEQNYGSLGQNSNTEYGYSSPVQVPGTWQGIFPLGSRSTGAFKS